MPYKRLLLEFAVQKIICASPYIELSSKDYRILQVKSSPSAEFPSVLPKKKKKWKIRWGVPVSIRWQHEVEPLSRGWCEAELSGQKASIAVLPRVGEQSCSGTALLWHGVGGPRAGYTLLHRQGAPGLLRGHSWIEEVKLPITVVAPSSHKGYPCCNLTRSHPMGLQTPSHSTKNHRPRVQVQGAA